MPGNPFGALDGTARAFMERHSHAEVVVAMSSFLDKLSELNQLIGRHQARTSSTMLKVVVEAARALYTQYKSYMEADVPDLTRMIAMVAEVGYQVRREGDELVQIDSDFRANAKLIEDLFEQVEIGRIKSVEEINWEYFKTAFELFDKEVKLWDRVEIQVNIFRNTVNAVAKGFQKPT